MASLRSKTDNEWLVAIFWVIWSARNQFLFKGKKVNPQVLVAKPEVVINAYKRTQAPTFAPVGNQQRLVQRTWSPPTRGYFKLNVDASINSKKQISGLGIVIRDEAGNVSAAAIKLSKFNGDVAFVEAEAMEWGIQIAEKAGARCLNVESDSQEVVNFVNNRRGFGNKTDKTNKEEKKGVMSQPKRKSLSKQSGSLPTQAPILGSGYNSKSNNSSSDIDFEERLAAVRRSALEQKKAEEIKEFGPIDYDAPIETEKKTIGLGTKIGVGVAVVIFGLVFALGDFLPSGSVSPTEEAGVVNKELSEEEKNVLQTRLKKYEETLSISPKDSTALEGAAVTLAELGDYTRAVSLLQDLAKEKPSDPDVFRLLGEVKYELKDYEGSAAAYRVSTMVSKDINFEVLRGLTNALLAAKKPDEAVQFLLASRERLSTGKSDDLSVKDGRSGDKKETEPQKVDPIQVELLLGKAYSDGGRVSDAVAVYDRLISSYPNDFRGYLAKGIILKENGKVGDAERMFIQARFFAPEKVKALVDQYSKRIGEQQLKAFHMLSRYAKLSLEEQCLRMISNGLQNKTRYECCKIYPKKWSKKRKGADNHRICWGIWHSSDRSLFENKKEDPKIMVAKQRL
ncbi:TPR REGION domain-containing protein [Citrus sinensis]|uniref:TPR REGION domain-containing protein n=1 Tax=Citrus sinensis TaxID=2711 RepID=A0ACB8JG40_CITSI|nr:TPR REGION domain-containing protein [Citrus sinensis]